MAVPIFAPERLTNSALAVGLSWAVAGMAAASANPVAASNLFIDVISDHAGRAKYYEALGAITTRHEATLPNFSAGGLVRLHA